VREDEFLIVHTSNVRPPKRIDLLLRTFAATRSARAMRLLILAGDPFAPYEALLAELELGERVLVRENVTDVEEYLAAGDAGLYTSETESFGLSILETLFHGKPVVAFRVGGIPEVVMENESGFLHPFNDTEAMAASLDRLASSPELAAAGALPKNDSPRRKSCRDTKHSTAAWLRNEVEAARSPYGASRLTGELEQEHLAPVRSREVKLDRAIASNGVRGKSKARAPAVNLVQAGMRADVKLAPGFDENCGTRLLHKQPFERRPIVSHILDWMHGLDRCVVEWLCLTHSRRR
ncbi:MAG: glycosyltransferase, partial [Chthoniobacterales bacterium]